MALDRPLDTLSALDFRGSIGARFQVRPATSEEGSGEDVQAGDFLELELREVIEQTGLATGSFRTPFTVIFLGPLEPVMPQGSYHLEHDDSGAMDLFLVPIGPDNLTEPVREPTAMRYEAVFG